MLLFIREHVPEIQSEMEGVGKFGLGKAFKIFGIAGFNIKIPVTDVRGEECIDRESLVIVALHDPVSQQPPVFNALLI